MGDIYDPGRRCSGTFHAFHTAFFYLFGLLLLASLSLVSAARPVRHTIPRFLDTPNNITAVVGSDVVLPCSVANLGTKLVIWKKATQYNPITVGEDIFAPESRYDIVRSDPYMSREDYEKYRHGHENPRWNLQIRDVGMQDAGTYKCRVSTKENILREVMLHVVGYDNPTLEEDTSRRKQHRKLKKTGIKLTGTDYVEKGSTIDLNCTATSIDYRPKGVDWFKDGSPIKVGRRTLINEYLESDTNILYSRLEIRRANMDDAGTYVCRFSQTHVESIKVMVLNTDSSNKRRGTAIDDIARPPPFPSQTSQTRDRPDGRYNKGWNAEQGGRSKGAEGGSGSIFQSRATSIHLWCLCLLVILTQIFRTAT